MTVKRSFMMGLSDTHSSSCWRASQALVLCQHRADILCWVQFYRLSEQMSCLPAWCPSSLWLSGHDGQLHALRAVHANAARIVVSTAIEYQAKNSQEGTASQIACMTEPLESALISMVAQLSTQWHR